MLLADRVTKERRNEWIQHSRKKLRSKDWELWTSLLVVEACLRASTRFYYCHENSLRIFEESIKNWYWFAFRNIKKNFFIAPYKSHECDEYFIWKSLIFSILLRCPLSVVGLVITWFSLIVYCQAGISESCWAIEFFSEAAQAYKLNNPKAEVFNEVCQVPTSFKPNFFSDIFHSNCI